MRWLVENTKNVVKTMFERLANELTDAYHGKRGG